MYPLPTYQHTHTHTHYIKGIAEENLRGAEIPEFEKMEGVLQIVKVLGKDLGHSRSKILILMIFNLFLQHFFLMFSSFFLSILGLYRLLWGGDLPSLATSLHYIKTIYTVTFKDYIDYYRLEI